MSLLAVISSTRAFPTIIIVLEAAAAVRWAAARNWSQALYWVLATGLVAVVTFGMSK